MSVERSRKKNKEGILILLEECVSLTSIVLGVIGLQPMTLDKY